MPSAMAKKVVRTSATGEETVFDSLSKAAVETASVSKSTLIRYLKAGLGSALGGYTWKFVAEPAAEPAAAGPEPVEPIVEPIELEEPVVPSSETVHEPAATDADIEHVRSFFEALRTDDGRLITEMRVSDGYVNATKMCQSAKKDCGNYLRNQGTIIFIDEFSRSTGIPGDLLVQTTMTGPNENRGTWVHPDVAIDLARHCSPAFHVKVIEIVRRYASGQITTSESQAAARMAAASMKDAEFDNRKRKMELDQREWEIEKKRREEGLELAKTQQAMEEKRLELSKAQRQMELADPKHVVESYFSLCEKYGLPLESTDRLIAKDYIKNAIFKPGGPSESRVLLPHIRCVP